MTTSEFRPDTNLIFNGVAVKLVSFVETIGDQDFWWCEKIFVAADAIMVAFPQHGMYRKLHTEKAVCST